MVEEEVHLKKPISLRAKILFIGELQLFRRNNRPDFSKRMVTLETEDGQILYCEIRNSKISLINPMKKGDIVDVDIIFAGSEKNGKCYNNLYIVNIEKI